MAKTRAVKINAEVFKKLVTEKAGDISKGAIQCGYSRKGFDYSIKTGSMAESMTILVDKVLGIPVDAYEYTEKSDSESPVKDGRTLTGADLEAIRQIINEEVQKVWN